MEIKISYVNKMLDIYSIAMERLKMAIPWNASSI